MRNFVALVTAAAIVVHATIGCCAHLSHVCAGAGEDVSDEATRSPGAVQLGCTHHNHQANLTLGSSPREGGCDQQSESTPPHECRHSSCHWTVGESGGIEFAFQAAALLFSFGGMQQQLTDCRYQSAFDRTLHDSSRLKLPVRSHLALGVLLI